MPSLIIFSEKVPESWPNSWRLWTSGQSFQSFGHFEHEQLQHAHMGLRNSSWSVSYGSILVTSTETLSNFWMFMFVWSIWIKLACWSSKGLWVQLGFTKLQPLRFPASMFHWHVRRIRDLNWWPMFSACFLGTKSLSNCLDMAVRLSQLSQLQFYDTPPIWPVH